MHLYRVHPTNLVSGAPPAGNPIPATILRISLTSPRLAAKKILPTSLPTPQP